MMHLDKVAKWLKEPGVEIGPFKTPIPGIKPFYVDKYQYFANERCLADYYGEAITLPFRSNSLNYVASSHVFEHVANPIQAFAEWYRVLRPGGIIYMVVPDRRYTWDRHRQLTPVSHLFDDFNRQTTSVDGTHISDLVDNLEWSTYAPHIPSDQVDAEKAKLKASYLNAIKTGNEINIHFHVFEPSNVLELVESLKRFAPHPFRWTLVDQAERFPADNPIGFLAVIKVHKGPLDWIRATLERWRWKKQKNAVLTPDAKAF